MNDHRKSSKSSRSGSAVAAELSLKRAVSFYEAVLGNMGEGVYTVDATGVVASMNPAAEKILGWTLDELRGRKMHDVIHYQHRDGTVFPTEDCAGFRVLNTGTPVFDQDDVFIHKDGSFFDVRYTSSPIIEMGETTGLVVVFRDVTERKLIENKLRESEARFSKFMNHLPGLAWIKDGEGRYVFANAAAQAAFQTSMQDLAGKSDEEVFPPETAAAFIENDRLARRNEGGRQTVETLRDEKGILRHSIVSKFPIPTADRQPPMVGGIAIDITEQKRAEQNHEFLFRIAEKIRLSRNAEELLADIANLLGEYLEIHRCLFNEIDLERDTEIVHSDYFRTGNSVAGTHTISEYSPITSESMTSGQTVVNRDSRHDPRTANLFEKIYGPNNEVAYVAVPLLREGKWVASLWCSDDKPHDWTDQEVNLLEGIAERVWSAVERMRAEEAKARLAAIVEFSDDAIISKDLNGIITSWNRGAERVFGYRADEVVGQPVTILMPPDRVNEEPGILKRIRRGESIDHYETVRRRKDGTLLDISLTVSPIFDAARKIVGASKVARDITERKRAEEALREARAQLELELEDTNLLHTVSTEMLHHENVEVLYEKIIDAAVRITKSDFASMQMLHPERGGPGGAGELQLLAYRGFAPEAAEFWGWVRADSASTCGEALRTLKRAIASDLSRCEYMAGSEDLTTYLNTGIAACQTTPLISRSGKLVGMISTHWNKPHEPSERDLRLIDILARQAADLIERNNAEQTLRRSAETFSTLVQQSPLGIYTVDSQFRVANFSVGALPAFQNVQPVIGRDFAEVMHAIWPDPFASEAIRIFRHTLETGEPYVAPGLTETRRDLGSTESYEWQVHRVVLADGQYGVVCYYHDITRIREAVDALKESKEKARISENQLRLVTDSIPALVSYVGADERYKFVNRTYCDWFGLPKEKILGKKMQTVIGGRAYRVLKDRVHEALTGTTVTFEANVNYKVAGNRFISGAYVPDIGDKGEVRGLYVLITDVSDLKRSEELLRSSQERMRILTESFTDYAIFSTDMEGRIDTWNPGAANIFGYDEAEILGQPYEMLFTPEDVMRGVPIKEMRLARKSGRASNERWQTRKDGTRFFASGVMAPLYVGTVLSGYAKITSDLTEKQRNAEALQHSHDELESRVIERTLELAAANAALVAEINERKTAERQKIEFLQRLVTSQEDQRQRIARDLHDQLGQRLTALRLKIAAMKEVCEHDENLRARAIRLQEISELLDSEVSFLAWELRPFALDELGLVDAVGTFVREWSKHYEIPAEFHSSGLAKIQLDKNADSHLYRIAQEALNNVVKHARATGVNVLLEKMGNEVLLIVEDDGIGMSSNQESNGRKGGKGLGLEGMRERASLIGGVLEIESAPSAGTTIYVRVPLDNEQQHK